MKTMTNIDHSKQTPYPLKKSSIAHLAIYGSLFVAWFIIQLQK